MDPDQPLRTRRNSQEVLASAYHEAGHAVIAVVHGRPFTKLTVSGPRGPSICLSAITFETAMQEQMAAQTIEIGFSGFVAERIYRLRTGLPIEPNQRLSSLDEQLILPPGEYLGFDGYTVAAKFLPSTKKLVEEHWSAIHSLALVLHKKRRLGYGAAYAIALQCPPVALVVEGKRYPVPHASNISGR